MAEQKRVFTFSIRSNFLEMVLKIQDESNVLVDGVESSVIKSMISRVEHKIRADEKTNWMLFCKDRIFHFAKQIKIRGQKV